MNTVYLQTSPWVKEVSTRVHRIISHSHQQRKIKRENRKSVGDWNVSNKVNRHEKLIITQIRTFCKFYLNENPSRIIRGVRNFCSCKIHFSKCADILFESDAFKKCAPKNKITFKWNSRCKLNKLLTDETVKRTYSEIQTSVPSTGENCRRVHRDETKIGSWTKFKCGVPNSMQTMWKMLYWWNLLDVIWKVFTRKNFCDFS